MGNRVSYDPTIFLLVPDGDYVEAKYHQLAQIPSIVRTVEKNDPDQNLSKITLRCKDCTKWHLKLMLKYCNGSMTRERLEEQIGPEKMHWLGLTDSQLADNRVFANWEN